MAVAVGDGEEGGFALVGGPDPSYLLVVKDAATTDCSEDLHCRHLQSTVCVHRAASENGLARDFGHRPIVKVCFPFADSEAPKASSSSERIPVPANTKPTTTRVVW